MPFSNSHLIQIGNRKSMSNTFHLMQLLVFITISYIVTSKRPLKEFKTGLRAENNQIFHDFVQINQNKQKFYQRMRKCNLDCYTSERCSKSECSICRKNCRKNNYSLDSACLDGKCSSCRRDKSVFSGTCKKCQRRCLRYGFKNVFGSCFQKCKLDCFKKPNSKEKVDRCRYCITKSCCFEP